MARTKPPKRHNKSKAFKRAHDVKRRPKDEDVIYNEYLNPTEQNVDVDLPGLGQFYCQVCAKYYKDADSRDIHYTTPLHKRLLKKIRTQKPYTVEESFAAAGIGSYHYNAKGFKPGEKSLGEKKAEAEATLVAEQQVNEAMGVEQ